MERASSSSSDAAASPLGGGTRRRIKTDAYSQQGVGSYRPLYTSEVVMMCLLVAGVISFGTGVAIKIIDRDEVFQRKVENYHKLDDCKISRANEGRVCNVTVRAEEKMKAPVYVYYELENFYQNHQRYVTSLEYTQLLGRNKKESDLSGCSPLKKNGSKILSPCGLIANSLFNDIISLEGKTMRENDIAWKSDLQKKFKQPNKFEWAKTDLDVSSCYKSECPEETCQYAAISTPCFGYVCRGGDYDAGKCESGDHVVYYYKGSKDYQFLYQTFPDIVSPIVGVKNEHFVVWMQIAGLSTFRKLYGRITDDVEKGEVLRFSIVNNFDVGSFGGTKSLVVTTTSTLGANPKDIWLSFLSFGAASLFASFLIFFKLFLSPRKIGDTEYLKTD